MALPFDVLDLSGVNDSDCLITNVGAISNLWLTFDVIGGGILSRVAHKTRSPGRPDLSLSRTTEPRV